MSQFGQLEEIRDEEISLALDQALVERATSAEREEITAERLLAPVEISLTSAEEAAEWFLGIEGRQVGPLGPSAVQRLLNAGEADAMTLCWREGYAGWKPLWSVFELGTAPTMVPLGQEPVTPPVVYATTDGLSSMATEEMGAIAQPVIAHYQPPAYDAQLPAGWSVPAVGWAPVQRATAPAQLPTLVVVLLSVAGALALMLVGVLVFLLTRPTTPAPARAVPAVVAAPPAVAPKAAAAPVVPLPALTLSPASASADKTETPSATPPPKRPVHVSKPQATELAAETAESPPTDEKEAAEVATPSEESVVAPSPAPAKDEFDREFGAQDDGAGSSSGRTTYVPPAPGASSVPETLPTSDIVASMLSHRSAIQACTAAQQKASPGKSGTLVMGFTIAPAGTTSEVAPTHPDAANGAFAACLGKEIPNWTFPRHTGSPQPVEFPFNY